LRISFWGKYIGPKRGKFAAGWRKLHDEWLHHFNSSPDVSRMMKCSRIGRRRFVGRPRCRGKNRTKMDLRVMGRGV
jgi:hypothetical protein